MVAFWRKECASETNATWFVGVEDARVSVLAPPGASVSPRSESDPDTRQKAFGWRWAVWNREHIDSWPSIDEDRPAAIREIDTVGVLRLLGNELTELVWRCLWTQLQVARKIGRQQSGRVPSEDLARAGAQSVAWLSEELTRAFPDRAHLLDAREPSGLLGGVGDAPGDPTELIQPSCAHAHVAHASPGHGSETLRHAMVRWIALRLLERHLGDWDTKQYRTWRPGDHLDGCPTCLDERPVDLSTYSWGNASIGGTEAATEELIHI